MRLTAVYSGLFLLTSTIMLTAVNLLLSNRLGFHTDVTDRLPDGASPGPANGPPPHLVSGSTEMDRLSSAVLRYQWTVTGIMIVALTIFSVAAGWWLAGRLLRPLQHITATAHQLSVSNLHERIGLTGPHDELRELGDTFDAMLARLERSVDSQRRFIANAAHELRTPLATQRAAIQIGLEDPIPRHLVEVREKLLAANRRTERLIDSLLVLAQAEHGLDSVEPVALDLLTRQVVQEAATDDVTISLDTRPVLVVGDAVLLTRLLTNLVQNAVRYNHQGGTVHVGLTETGILTVRNTGPEVPTERIAELFQPFRRLQPRTRIADDGGAGLGLSIVASISQAHQATVTAVPNPDGGLELTVRFPAQPAVVGADGR